MATRRDFIRNSSVALALAGLDPVRVFADPQRTPALRISISESFVPAQWRAALESEIALNANTADRVFLAALKTRPPTFDRIPAATDVNTVRLISLSAPGVEPFAPKRASDLAIQANDALAEALSAAGSSHRGLATVCAFDRRAVKEAERAIGALNMGGLNLGANRGMTLDHPSLEPVYEYAAAVGVPIYLPAAYSATVGDLPYRATGNAGVVFGASADSSKHATQLIFGGVFDRHPKLRVILARLGEGTPYWYSHIRDTYLSLKHAGAAAPARAAQDYFSDNIMLTTADMSPSALQFAVSMLGESRIVSSHDVATA